MNVLITKVLFEKFNRPCTQMLFNCSEVYLWVKSLRKVPSMTVGFLSLPLILAEIIPTLIGFDPKSFYQSLLILFQLLMQLHLSLQ